MLPQISVQSPSLVCHPAHFVQHVYHSEVFTLSAMACDRCVAVCNPLLHTGSCHKGSLTDQRPFSICTASFCLCWPSYKFLFHRFVVIISLNISIVIVCPWYLCFVQTCEIRWVILIFSIFNLVSSLLIVLVSYILILVAIFRMNQEKADTRLSPPVDLIWQW